MNVFMIKSNAIYDTFEIIIHNMQHTYTLNT